MVITDPIYIAKVKSSFEKNKYKFLFFLKSSWRVVEILVQDMRNKIELFRLFKFSVPILWKYRRRKNTKHWNVSNIFGAALCWNLMLKLDVLCIIGQQQEEEPILEANQYWAVCPFFARTVNWEQWWLHKRAPYIDILEIS